PSSKSLAPAIGSSSTNKKKSLPSYMASTVSSMIKSKAPSSSSLQDVPESLPPLPQTDRKPTARKSIMRVPNTVSGKTKSVSFVPSLTDSSLPRGNLPNRKLQFDETNKDSNQDS